jgi:hypothetical protein
MKSMFYGAAIAAVSGLMLGAGFKTPLMAEESAAEPMEYVQAAAVADADYQPDYLNSVSYAPAPLQPISTSAQADDSAAYVTPAAYEPEPEPVATPDQPVPYGRASTSVDSVAPAEAREPEAAPPAVTRSQGFFVLEPAPPA